MRIYIALCFRCTPTVVLPATARLHREVHGDGGRAPRHELLAARQRRLLQHTRASGNASVAHTRLQRLSVYAWYVPATIVVVLDQVVSTLQAPVTL